MPGDKPVMRDTTKERLPNTLTLYTTEQTCIFQVDLLSLLMIQDKMKEAGIVAPRDDWESWIDASITRDDPTHDRAFMFLMTICMSSSTSDAQLSSVMPRIFSQGLTSSQAVLDICFRYGVDALCSIISESGLYYLNTEKIINAANYFTQRHDGRIPSSITIEELSNLYGIGYKTAAIVVESSFGRSAGIPSDVNVIRWSEHLGWVPQNVDGFQCSKYLESWISKDAWTDINPLFGALSQVAVSSDANTLQSLVSQAEIDKLLKEKVLQLLQKYASYKRSS